MPSYVFRCRSCGHEFEVQTSWSAKGDTTCPRCGGRELKELFGRYRINTGASQPSTGTGSGGFT
ncbi:MAG: zinc ribbon domain-containing protein [Firmicutes bacterium]|nr:zinc ribbon domain-containing protein [Bacillota bacterium]